jgi:hypothetical protein
MKYTISETTKTVTVETTEADGAVSLNEMEKAVKRFAKMYVDEPKTQAIEFKPETAPTPIDETPDPLEDLDLNYTDVAPEVLASEELANMVPANIMAAE